MSDEAADRTLIRTGELGPVLAALAAENDVMHLLCEGGGGLAAQLLEANLVDELVMIVAPKILGADGRPCFNFMTVRWSPFSRDVLLIRNRWVKI